MSPRRPSTANGATIAAATAALARAPVAARRAPNRLTVSTSTIGPKGSAKGLIPAATVRAAQASSGRPRTRATMAAAIASAHSESVWPQ